MTRPPKRAALALLGVLLAGPAFGQAGDAAGPIYYHWSSPHAVALWPADTARTMLYARFDPDAATWSFDADADTSAFWQAVRGPANTRDGAAALRPWLDRLRRGDVAPAGLRPRSPAAAYFVVAAPDPDSVVAVFVGLDERAHRIVFRQPASLWTPDRPVPTSEVFGVPLASAATLAIFQDTAAVPPDWSVFDWDGFWHRWVVGMLAGAPPPWFSYHDAGEGLRWGWRQPMDEAAWAAYLMPASVGPAPAAGGEPAGRASGPSAWLLLVGGVAFGLVCGFVGARFLPPGKPSEARADNGEEATGQDAGPVLTSDRSPDKTPQTETLDALRDLLTRQIDALAQLREQAEKAVARHSRLLQASGTDDEAAALALLQTGRVAEEALGRRFAPTDERRPASAEAWLRLLPDDLRRLDETLAGYEEQARRQQASIGRLKNDLEQRDALLASIQEAMPPMPAAPETPPDLVAQIRRLHDAFDYIRWTDQLGGLVREGERAFLSASDDVASTAALSFLVHSTLHQLCLSQVVPHPHAPNLRAAMLANLDTIAGRLRPYRGFKELADALSADAHQHAIRQFRDVVETAEEERDDYALFLYQPMLHLLRREASLDVAPFYYGINAQGHARRVN